MADVDAARIIYYTAPYRWLEALFSGWLADGGHSLSAMLDGGTTCPCVASSALYHRPMRLDDTADLVLVAERVGRTSMVLRLDARLPDGGLAVQAWNTLVWTESGADGGFSTVEVPSWMRAHFAPTPRARP
jgi:acyl-CoA thioesterase FadM